MTWVRGQEHFVYQRAYRQVRDRMLDELGWDGTALGRLPWGATKPITFMDVPKDPKLDALEPNIVAITEGMMPDDEDEMELGGVLRETTHTLFIDVFAESISIARRIATDVRSILTGRAAGTSRYLSVPNYAVAGEPDMPGHLIHFEDVEVSFPDGVGQAHWAVVKATVVHEWSG